MSEKTRRKKDGEDKNKNNQRMREVTKSADKQNAATQRQDRTASGGAKK